MLRGLINRLHDNSCMGDARLQGYGTARAKKFWPSQTWWRPTAPKAKRCVLPGSDSRQRRRRAARRPTPTRPQHFDVFVARCRVAAVARARRRHVGGPHVDAYLCAPRPASPTGRGRGVVACRRVRGLPGPWCVRHAATPTRGWAPWRPPPPTTPRATRPPAPLPVWCRCATPSAPPPAPSRCRRRVSPVLSRPTRPVTTCRRVTKKRAHHGPRRRGVRAG